MKIFLVTKAQLEEKRCGTYKDFYCYLISFFRYRKERIRGAIFSTAKQAINYMIRNAK